MADALSIRQVYVITCVAAAVVVGALVALLVTGAARDKETTTAERLIMCALAVVLGAAGWLSAIKWIR